MHQHLFSGVNTPSNPPHEIHHGLLRWAALVADIHVLV